MTPIVGAVLSFKSKFNEKDYDVFVQNFTELMQKVEDSTEIFTLLIQDSFPKCVGDIMNNSKAIMDSAVLFKKFLESQSDEDIDKFLHDFCGHNGAPCGNATHLLLSYLDENPVDKDCNLM